MRQMTYYAGTSQVDSPDGEITSKWLFPYCTRETLKYAMQYGTFVTQQLHGDFWSILSKRSGQTIVRCRTKEQAEHIRNLIDIERLLSQEIPDWIVFDTSQLGDSQTI